MKTVIIASLLLVPLLARASPDAAPADPRHAALARLEAEEPTLAQVQQAALRHAGLAGRTEAAWSRRVRLSALLPAVTITVDRGTGNDRDLSRNSNGTERLDVGMDEDVSFQARAVWHLDRLLFSDVELRAIRAAQQQNSERVRLTTQVATLYFQRRKLQIAAIWSQVPGQDASKAALARLAIDELTAQLDTLTGGYLARAR